jgi:hypothetical protein
MENIINYVGGVTPNYNMGDEALYKIDQEIFAKYPFKFCRITSPLRQKHSQITLVGGGTCLPAIAMLMRPTKYAYVFGAGVLDSVFHGPFEPELIDRFKLINFRLISVRGNISKALLKDWGIDSEVIGDPCLSLKPTKVLEKCNNRIAINVGAGFSKFSWGSRDRVLRELSKVCSVLKNRGYEVVLIPFWKNNMQDVENLSKKVGVGIFEKWQDIEATLNLISNCKIFIGEKLHSLVFSAAANTPFIGLAYAPEHFDFADSVGFSKFTIPTTEITAEKIMDLFNDLIGNYETIQGKLASHVNEYREKQSRFADRISSDLDSLPENKWVLQNNRANTLITGVDLLINAKLHRTWGIWNKLVFSPLAPYLFYHQNTRLPTRSN